MCDAVTTCTGGEESGHPHNAVSNLEYRVSKIEIYFTLCTSKHTIDPYLPF